MRRSSFIIGGIAATALATLATGQAMPGVPTPLAWAIRIITLISAIIIHEIAHGLVAERLGDPTARMRGRLTLNPIPHIDIVGSIIIPGFLLISGSLCHRVGETDTGRHPPVRGPPQGVGDHRDRRSSGELRAGRRVRTAF